MEVALDLLLPRLAAIAIEGAKGGGKTETAQQRCRTARALDNPYQRQALEALLGLIEGRSASLRDVDHPMLIDEWHLVSLWDGVRREVDRNAAGGQHLFTRVGHAIQ